MKNPKFQILFSLFCFCASASNGAGSSGHKQSQGGQPQGPQVLTGVAISMVATTGVDIYCAATKKSWPPPPAAKGSITVGVPGAKEPFIAGDNAPKAAYQWKQSPKPLPNNPTTVTYTCANSRLLPPGAYGWGQSESWSPNPAPCWSTQPFSVVVNVSGGFVDPAPAPGVTSGTIYIPRLNHSTVYIARDDIGKPDGNENRTTIGVGERVSLEAQFLPSTEVISWTSFGNGKITLDRGASTTFQALDGAGAGGASVALGSGRWGSSVTFSVLQPASARTKRVQKNPVGQGRIGASMDLEIIVEPTSVSFGEVVLSEQGLPDDAAAAAPINPTGYFPWANFTWATGGVGGMDIRHTPNLLPTTLSGINACLDHAHFIPPWPIPTDAPATGGVSWKIPYTWKVLNIGAAHPNSFDLTQEFKLSAGGAAKVKKGPAEVERNQSEP